MLPCTKAAVCRDVLAEAAAEIVEHVHLVAAGDERVGNVRPDEPRPTGHKYSAHRVLVLLVFMQCA